MEENFSRKKNMIDPLASAHKPKEQNGTEQACRYGLILQVSQVLVLHSVIGPTLKTRTTNLEIPYTAVAEVERDESETHS